LIPTSRFKTCPHGSLPFLGEDMDIISENLYQVGKWRFIAEIDPSRKYLGLLASSVAFY
jgi:hypothetical protein